MLLVEVFVMSFFWSVLLREADQKEWPVCFLLQDTTLNSAGLVLIHQQTAIFLVESVGLAQLSPLDASGDD